MTIKLNISYLWFGMMMLMWMRFVLGEDISWTTIFLLPVAVYLLYVVCVVLVELFRWAK